ncbi:MAG: DnaJ domain-containing protein [Thermomonas hydrothermalis]|uniref:DnaJ domain-containing protein n=1 Tax=Thermomonas hydrothermalis TaxID=213588 RepID=UPI002353DA49|nr:DnaJ domain-containing protein [Thermomonas hydrothermalis]MCL6619668.1 DnaJ domain-containing protein [Thermomonas hydrothermalis]
MRRWYGQFFGFIAGWLLLRHPVGGFIGLLIGYLFDHDAFSSPRRHRPSARRAQPPPHEDDQTDWAYQVLGLTEQASADEIDRAYRKLISQYHPDRLVGAAPELQALAERKSREINAAYDRIQTLRKKTK